jgi:hypothetical protein
MPTNKFMTIKTLMDIILCYFIITEFGIKCLIVICGSNYCYLKGIQNKRKDLINTREDK